VDPTFRNWFYGGALFTLALGLWLAHLWSPENQVRLHSEHLMAQVEKRNWAAISDFIAADYHDEWNDDRPLLLARLRVALRLFSSLTIAAETPRVRVEAPLAMWRGKIRIAGSGAEITPEMVERINRLTTPFELRWRKESWPPWHWKLVQVHNHSLDLPADL
jgi:hypothetical protein